ncbi:MAG: DUF1501 domain-containing protein [Planctomycetes bacterium]|nr:DUF1501 domain-containing protein [Planctomycetota bacterium]
MSRSHVRSTGCREFQSLARTRREVLKVGALGTLGFGLADLLRLAPQANAASPAAGGKAKPVRAVILLQKYGAPSQIDTWDMKPEAPPEIRGEFAAIPTAIPGYRVCEHMPFAAKHVGRMTIVRSMAHTVANHNPATYYSLTGRTSEADVVQVGSKPDDWPNMGAALAKLRPGDGRLPESVVLPHLTYDQIYTTPGQFGGILGKRYDPFVIAQDPSRTDFSVETLQLPQGLSIDRLDDRRRLLEAVDRQQRNVEQTAAVVGMDQYYDRAWSLLTSPDAKRAFDINAEPDAVRDRYGRNIVGQSMLLARRLVEAGVSFVTCYHGLNPGDLSGWDTHTDNFNGLKNRLLPPDDRGFAALIEDLDERGLLDSTLLVWGGEFGRSPKIGKPAVTERIAPAGRDHWPFAYSIALVGGGVKQGHVCGRTDHIGAYPVGTPYGPEDLAATIFWALGIDPRTHIHDRLGRPFPLAEGLPATEWFA